MKKKIYVKIVKNCLECGKQIVVTSKKSRVVKYCSVECGRKNKGRPSKHGNITKITGFKSCSRDRVRELIRIRDNHTCQICGKKWVEGKRRFDVHHKDCDKEKTLQCDNYEKEKDNMITLCHKCHLNLPEHKRVMKLEYRKSA
jgi:5-methylcytosine-specific restriction endonuclease McrA